MNLIECNNTFLYLRYTYIRAVNDTHHQHTIITKGHRPNNLSSGGRVYMPISSRYDGNAFGYK